MRILSALVPLVTLAIAGCADAPMTSRAPVPRAATASNAPPTAAGTFGVRSGRSSRGLEFAKARCSGCHAIASGQFSSNPDAPTFETIVNTPGLSTQTLDVWLRNSHNFPEVMKFDIEADQIDDLKAYMMTLVRSDFKPPTQ